ncbi:MAG TPA: sugar phosphate nucleotidyltransferase [Opitutaceae bacterium]|nr:sugar phosphate nucleotidyltransferase [Opitutaceae bacterium]
MSNRFAVIMAGGRGERFWPQSRHAKPKHLLPIVGDKPLLAQTIARLQPLIALENILVITNRHQEAAVREVAAMLPAANIIAEPVGRDTAAATGLAAVLVAARTPDAAFAMLPADHVIHDAAEYRTNLEAAFVVAEREDSLVTLGIRPTEPASGFGYIQRGEPVEPALGRAVHVLTRFVEKPTRAVAIKYLESGDYFWNAGMFVWRAPVVTAAFAEHAPTVWEGLGEVAAGLARGEALDGLLERLYPAIPKISVDYAIMEKARNCRVLPASFDWDDVGSWPAITRHFGSDDAGNVVLGSGLVEQGAGNLVVSTGDHLVTVLGTEDLIVVHTPDATLVCPKARAEEIKALLKRVEANPELRGLL